MIPKFFGQYLIEKLVITPEQLIKAIEYQDRTRRKLGEIAEEKGFITESQARMIHEKQKRTDRRFGELAEELKLLTDSQVEEIVLIQKNHHIYLGDALVAVEVISQKEVDEQLEEFKKLQSHEKQVEFHIPFDHPQSETLSYFLDLTCKLIMRIGDLPVKPGPASAPSISHLPNPYVSVTIDFSGDMACKYSLLLTEQACRRIAEVDLQETGLDEEIIKENAGELVNVICGNIVGLLEKNGKRVEISIPKLEHQSESKEISIDPSKDNIYMPISTTSGLCSVLLSISKKEVHIPTPQKEIKVLIVDDSKSVGLRLTKLINQINGFEVVGHAIDGKSALKMYKETNPDLITMDIVLPDMSGLDVIRQLKELGSKTPVVVISSLGGSQEKVFQAIQSGATNVIIKPFETDKVKEVLQSSV